MPQSLANVIVHIVYSTKNRQPWLKDINLRDELYAYNAAILRNEVDSSAILKRRPHLEAAYNGYRN